MTTPITTFYLEMKHADALRPGREKPGLELRHAAIPSPDLSRFLYTSVGSGWYWTDRLAWDHRLWMDHLGRPELEVWVGYLGGNPIGYAELERQAGDACEIVYFGLLPQFIGQGMGGALLTEVVRTAWRAPTRRVWLHTCSLDGPQAMANYQARGFALYHQETEEIEIPPTSPKAWPA